MADRVLPGMGLRAFWDLGEDEWKEGMDGNLLQLSVVSQGRALDIVNVLPGSPGDGEVYILDELAGDHPNNVAVRDNGAWVYFVARTGWLLWVVEESNYYRFNGTEWVVFNPGLPDVTIDDSGKMVIVNVDGTGYELVDVPNSSGGGYREEGKKFRIRTLTAGSGGGSAWGTISFSDVNGFPIPPAGMINASSWTSEHQPYMVIDGDPATYWSFDVLSETAVGSWWEITFDNPKLVGYVILRPGLGQQAFSPSQFVVEYYSEIESDWIILGTYTTAWPTDDEQVFEVPLPPVISGGGGIPEAPEDGNEYVRKNGAWAIASTGGNPVESLVFAASDESTALSTGTGKITFRMPYAFTLTGIKASLSEAQASGSILTVDVNEGGSSILSTKLTIDNTEKTSATAATAPVISDPNLADDAEITVDIDQLGDGTAKGLKIAFIGSRP